MGASSGPVGRPRGVVELADVGPGTVAVVGGKAENLGALLAAGLPVPAGFCLTTELYDRAAEAAGLDEILDRLTERRDTEASSSAALAGPARERLRAAPVPTPVLEAVRDAYARLGRDVPVAVRSSATAEDLPDVSFAGQQDTYLGVVGPDALWAAVRRCWASLWTDRAVAYREAHGIDHRAISMAVVVQEMVDAAVSGVLFTANPVTGRRGEAVIDAAPGLGAALVGGSVNPDRWVVDVATRAILRRSTGPGPAGGASGELSGGPGRTLCLTDAQVLDVTALGARAESCLGQPQDVEWSVDRRGRIVLLQSRPVTTLYPLPEPDRPPDGGVRAFVCASLLQGIHGPLTPMGLSLYDVVLAGYRPPAGVPAPFRYVHPGLRLYMDITATLAGRAGRAMFLGAMRIADAPSVALLRHLTEDPRFSATEGWSVRSILGLYRSLPQLQAVPQVILAVLRPAAARERGRRAEVAVRRVVASLPAHATAAGRLDAVERVLGRTLMDAVMDQLPPAVAAYVWFGIARWLLGRRARRGELPPVLRGLPGNVTTDMDLNLWRTATRLREDPASASLFLGSAPGEIAQRYAEGSLPQVAQHELRQFLRAYGHRAVAEIDVGAPRWSDDPTHVVNVLANYLRLEDPELAPDRQFARAAAEAEAMAAELAGRAGGPRSVRGRAVAYGLRRARAAAGLREQPKFAFVLVLAGLRAQLRRVGEDLADAGRIEDAEDVFFLDLTEARVGLRGADLRDVVAQRRRTYQHESRRRHVPRLLLSDGTDLEAALAAEAAEAATTAAGDRLPPGTLAGAPASAGSVTARARVVLDPASARLEPGEILVTPSTDPGWTPLFLTAGGLVMEMGGAMSHGAVVAREYGLPAVVGVVGATGLVRTGETLTVDGAAGTVTKVSEPAPPP
ncbi:pyruvate,water dikinase [Georgenia soli]|uniref:Pyruvate,water dikinase n=1 Tax=Georgenia soli TaxID=638953 RepID=A0A2A9ERP7_9MICO|nr:PEP/pyruvate-binding domain-containing protein [Georgenia soli]PFG40915.1 pyruvate,water dikinase [Georgenia soli]